MYICLCCSSASLQAAVPVFYLSHPADQVLALGCPGARSNMAVAWDQGSVPIYRSEHSAGGNLSPTPPRLLIDTGHHLVFKPAKTHDSGANIILHLHFSVLLLYSYSVYLPLKPPVQVITSLSFQFLTGYYFKYVYTVFMSILNKYRLQYSS